MVLQDEGIDDLSVTGSSTFTFDTALPAGTSYPATAWTQPVGQSCVFANGSGSVGTAHVTDQLDNTILQITPAGVVTTFAGTAGARGLNDGNVTAASFNLPNGAVTGRGGNAYVADTLNHTVRRITPAGVVSTIAGVAGTAGFAPGALPGLLSNPRGLAMSGTTL